MQKWLFGIRRVDFCHGSWSFCGCWCPRVVVFKVGMPWMHVSDQGSHFKEKSLMNSIESCKSTNMWREILVIQSVLNHLPSLSRANCSPLKIITGLDAFRNWKTTWETWRNLWIKSTGKLKLRWKALGLPREGMLTRSAQLGNLTKEINLFLNLKISPNFSPDGIVLIKSLRLSQIGCLSSNILSPRLRKQCMLLAFNFTLKKTSM